MTDGYNNPNMDDESYEAENIVIQTGNLTYTPKKWADEEHIETVEMNNIEQGIQIALKRLETKVDGLEVVKLI